MDLWWLRERSEARMTHLETRVAQHGPDYARCMHLMEKECILQAKIERASYSLPWRFFVLIIGICVSFLKKGAVKWNPQF